MRTRYQGSLLALCALFFSSQAPAQSRCDCTTIVGSCQASVSAGDSFIEISSDAPQCARVDYVVDGAPFVTLVTEGTARQNRSGGNTPAVVVQSCQVCRDTLAAATDTAFGASLFTDGEVTRLIGVAPSYPQAARDAGIEGFVEVRFTVTPSGMVASPEVVDSNPAGIFDQAALAAVSRWRYTGNTQGESLTLTERLDFNLARELLSLRPASGNGSRALAAVAPVRNRCIQEQTRYDFGGVIDISLINACQDPLIVYSCSAGTGQNYARWTCRNPDAPGIMLGSLASSRLEISRAPNSEYWWLACGVDDTACQSEGRQWVRSLNQQTATIDPQDRTRARLARSY